MASTMIFASAGSGGHRVQQPSRRRHAAALGDPLVPPPLPLPTDPPGGVVGGLLGHRHQDPGGEPPVGGGEVEVAVHGDDRDPPGVGEGDRLLELRACAGRGGRCPSTRSGSPDQERTKAHHRRS